MRGRSVELSVIMVENMWNLVHEISRGVKSRYKIQFGLYSTWYHYMICETRYKLKQVRGGNIFMYSSYVIAKIWSFVYAVAVSRKSSVLYWVFI